ncbi:hypothetical protein [Paenibacillus lentus]|uniref:DUF4760 domain-containing protein n=1 Tax=Paenibacillus lentus TaxID=1338368 RepID=A0A3S8RQS8_9BACL|nr:hypothetical protein [Paenibacillus lentus]AZK45197.1 hypothetical protein EIM92_02440 [Paenibacillus lentus]
MKTVDILQNLGIFTIGSISLFGTIAWVFRLVFTSWMSNKSDSLKNDLVKVVENHKAELEKLKYEHQIRFSNLHQERASIIKELYTILVNLELSFDRLITPQFINGTEPDEKETDTAINNIDIFEEFYFRNRIFFNKEICEAVDKLIDIINKLWTEYKGTEITYYWKQSKKQYLLDKRNREKLSGCFKRVKYETG